MMDEDIVNVTDHDVVPSQKRRKRRPLNCWHCRIRKIKCDRTIPCSACLKSGDAATCSYIAQQPGKPTGTLNKGTAPEIEARINRLESLLHSVASSSNVSSDGSLTLSPRDSTSGDDSSLKDVTTRIGSMKVDPETNRTYYLGPSHWVSILSGVAELKDYISCEAQDLEKEAWDNWMYLSKAHVSLLRGITPAPTQEELLTWMPPKIIADMVINKFLASGNPMIALFHAPTFREQYAQHWAAPSKTPLAWLAMFYALLYHSEVNAEKDETWASTRNGAPGSETKGLYRMLTMKCLLASNYTRPRTYTLEAMLLLLGADYMTSSDAIDDTTLVLSILCRSAIQIGLHRSYPHPALSPFQREMRRRLWIMIHCMDVMHGAQVSLPPNIHQEDVDTTPPSNLYDTDFSPTSEHLPPSRPLSEITPITYYLLKYKHCLTLDKILKFTLSTPNPSRDQLKPYEDLILETTRSIPPRLQLDFAAESVSTASSLYLERIQLNRLTQFNICTLYRQFLTTAHSDQKLFHYRRSCIDAAMRSLQSQHEYQSHFINPSFPNVVNKQHLLAVTSVDFYTAGMAIAIDLYHGIKAEPTTPKDSDIKIWGFDRRPEMMDALQRSTKYWEAAKADSIEAAKAWGVFGYVLEKCRNVLAGKAETVGGSVPSDANVRASTEKNGTAGQTEQQGVSFDAATGDLDWGFLDAFEMGCAEGGEGAFQW